jgi:hypothetical protein
MTVVLSAEVLLDVLLRHERHFDESVSVLRIAAESCIDCVVSASSLADVYSQVFQRTGAQKAKSAVARLTGLCTVAAVLPEDVLLALSYPTAELPVALCHAIAQRLGADCVVARPPQDIPGLPTLTPAEFLAVAKI